MILKSKLKRKAIDVSVKILSSVAAIIGIIVLVWIIYEVAYRGFQSINFDFFTKLPSAPGTGEGGIASAITGTILITLISIILGVPAGIMAGIYLSEFGLHSKIGSLVRFLANVMMGIPTIIIGLFVYAIMVIPLRHFSGYAGSLALAIIMLPIVARTTEDMLRLVPNEIRESALALGAPLWKVTTGVVFRAARSGILTGIILGIARVSGETAPLLFTALNSPFWPESLNRPTANLTVTIFNYSMSPYNDWQKIAWGASLVIMVSILLLTIFTRFIFKARQGEK